MDIFLQLRGAGNNYGFFQVFPRSKKPGLLEQTKLYSDLCFPPTRWSWASHLASLRLSFLFGKTESGGNTCLTELSRRLCDTMCLMA